ncbi:NGFI-A-binding protein 2-like isoform X2 [Brienomyrus brachyistius]|uniref:NGFI-A-binding protein 2-like isoform X1 n=2 Tax=Brienomyrus brachyistius TaxID=42636 RepID=UPI0020B45515|nr:NGFI-A-binding protein 2-like isoform X1 [Brienomyrus brachyistius]XP_048856159.1 NGFI-A-binding protein 2-like isoform X2 [Brienomyrus brachyistius]
MVAMSLPRTLGELQLYRVLQRANLLAYYDTFIQQGGDDVQQLCEAGEEEFLEIMALVGMATKPLHVRRLQKALRDWAANPALFNQPLANVPLSSIPLFKIDTSGSSVGAGTRKSVSNGQPGSPCEREERVSLTPMRTGSPKSPSSQASPQPPDSLYRDKLSPMEPHWLNPDQDGGSTSGPMVEEEQSSPPLPPAAPSTPPASTSSCVSAWPGGRLDPEMVRLVADSVGRHLRTVPKTEPGEVMTLLNLNKKLAKTVGHIFELGPHDPAKEEEIRKYSLIYGRFDSRRREGKQLSHHEMLINEAAAQFCICDNALLLRRVELFSLARQVARECAYTSTLKKARTSTEECGLPVQKRMKQEVIVSDSPHDTAERPMRGSEGGHQGVLRPGTDEESLSGESLDGSSQDLGSQSSHSQPPCPAVDSSAHTALSRHLVRQALMDEGLRLARLVSHDHMSKGCPGTRCIQTTELEDKALEKDDSDKPCRRSSSCGIKDHSGKEKSTL